MGVFNGQASRLEVLQHAYKSFMLFTGFGFWNLVIFCNHPGELSAPDITHGIIQSSLGILAQAVDRNNIWVFQGTCYFTFQMKKCLSESFPTPFRLDVLGHHQPIKFQVLREINFAQIARVKELLSLESIAFCRWNTFKTKIFVLAFDFGTVSLGKMLIQAKDFPLCNCNAQGFHKVFICQMIKVAFKILDHMQGGKSFVLITLPLLNVGLNCRFK